MVVLWVLIQNQAANVVHWEVATRPDFGDIEGVETQLLWVGLFGLHDLHLGCPLDLLSILDGLPQLLLRIVGILARDADGLGLSQLLLAMLCDEVVLDVDEFAILEFNVSNVPLSFGSPWQA